MFDVFDILVPKLSAMARLEVRQQQTAFGLSDDRFAYYHNLRFARVLAAADAYSDVEAWAGSVERADWVVLLAGGTASRAAESDDTWARFLEGLVSVLSAHTFWQVICESDCDQYPTEHCQLSPQGLSALLDSYRTDGVWPIALQASPVGGSLSAS